MKTSLTTPYGELQATTQLPAGAAFAVTVRLTSQERAGLLLWLLDESEGGQYSRDDTCIHDDATYNEKCNDLDDVMRFLLPAATQLRSIQQQSVVSSGC